MNRRRFLKQAGLWVPAVLAFPAIVRAQRSVFSDPGRLGAISRRPAAAGFSWQENFETPTTGYERAWLAGGTGGTVAPATSTSGLSLEASQCLEIIASAQNPYTGSTFSSDLPEMWAYFLFRVHSRAAANQVFLSFLNSAGNPIVYLYVMSAGQLDWYDGTREAKPADAIATDTTYSVWLYYKKGTGANGLLTCEFATTPTQVGSGTKFASITNGVLTQDIQRIRIGNIAAITADFYVDKIRVQNSAIGSNPS